MEFKWTRLGGEVDVFKRTPLSYKRPRPKSAIDRYLRRKKVHHKHIVSVKIDEQNIYWRLFFSTSNRYFILLLWYYYYLHVFYNNFIVMEDIYWNWHPFIFTCKFLLNPFGKFHLVFFIQIPVAKSPKKQPEGVRFC